MKIEYNLIMIDLYTKEKYLKRDNLMNTDIEIIKEYIYNKSTDMNNSTTVINGRSYTFSQQRVPEMPVFMTLPDGIVLMEPYCQKIKYPNENRPDVILTVPTDETVNFLFTQIKEFVTEQDIPDVLQGIQSVIKKMHANSLIKQTGEIPAKLSNVCWFDYTVAAMDADIYNIMYILSLNDTLFIGGFCCLQEHHKQWKPLILEMIATITEEEDINNEKSF